MFGTSKSGRLGIGGISKWNSLSLSLPFIARWGNSLRRSASCPLTVIACPSRLSPSATTRPGGVSWIIRCNCVLLSMAVPFMVRITSCSLMPALPAGASWSTIVTSTPCSSFSFSAPSRSDVISAMSTPRYALLPESSLGMPKGGEDSIVHFCAACDRLSSSGSTAIVVKICLRMTNLLNTYALRFFAKAHRLLIRPLETDIAGSRPHLEDGTASVQLTLRVERPRSPLIAFAGNVDVREVGSDVMTIAQVDAGANRERDVRRDINGNISRRGFEPGIARWSAGFYKLHDDAAGPGLNPRRRNSIELDSTAARVSLDAPCGRGEVNA